MEATDLKELAGSGMESVLPHVTFAPGPSNTNLI